MPSFRGSDDVFRVGPPLEPLWFVIMGFDEVIDGLLQINDRVEDASLEATLGELGEEAFDGVQPGA